MIQISTVDNIVTITLNRPEIHNAFDDALIQQLTISLEKIAQDAAIKAVILAANGKSFCAGADVHWMKKMAAYSQQENLQDAHALARLMNTLYHLNKPTIALVQGAAMGGGVGLVACCDIAIANPEAIFCFSEVKIGLVPAVISPFAIKAIGERAARRYFLTAEKFDAAEAHRLGLVHKIVPATDLITAGYNMAKTLTSNSPQAVSATKQLIAIISPLSISSDVTQTTVECIANIRVSAEGQEGLSAFLEKRKANWL